MEKNIFIRALALTMVLSFFVLLSCSKDDDCETKLYYLDKDKDNFGAGEPATACSPPKTNIGQYVLQGGDADDNDANVNPGCALAFYLDDDGDGFGTGDPILFCVNPDPNKYTDFDGAFDCNDDDSSINPGVLATYYPDLDNDGYGDGLGQTISVPICDPTPEGYAANGDDCDDTNAGANPGAGQITYYLDLDNDGYGNEEIYNIVEPCEEVPENSSLMAGDCNDQDPTINPDAEDNPNDGIDSNCDGQMETVIWSGPDFQFSKLANDDWAAEGANASWDVLTDNVTLTRTTEGYITNIAWWLDVVNFVPSENEDLPWEYLGRKAQNAPIAPVGNAIPNGGPQGVRWAILEQGGNSQAWDNFDWYGTLGDPTHFYSLNNIVTICSLLNDNESPTNIVDDFGVDNTQQIQNEAIDYSMSSVNHLKDITLGVWLVEENIYFTMTIIDIPHVSMGNSITYIRSTPNN
ncbi:putative metal-binding motif-containing protein [Flagellimonas meishanensis]|uniref:putative metal-binding motif-containing protein n=1 Tax=Flagellimonas meishanensis TaxID=2873264 RepID=UPI001CA76D9D|nr:putative metal-binding motif-containing protein [[Muricauda] meishanensis]